MALELNRYVSLSDLAGFAQDQGDMPRRDFITLLGDRSTLLGMLKFVPTEQDRYDFAFGEDLKSPASHLDTINEKRKISRAAAQKRSIDVGMFGTVATIGELWQRKNPNDASHIVERNMITVRAFREQVAIALMYGDGVKCDYDQNQDPVLVAGETNPAKLMGYDTGVIRGIASYYDKLGKVVNPRTRYDHVVDMGGTDPASNTSLYLMAVALPTMHLVYNSRVAGSGPGGSGQGVTDGSVFEAIGGGFSIREINNRKDGSDVHITSDANGMLSFHKLSAFDWSIGLALKNPYSIIRLANINPAVTTPEALFDAMLEVRQKLPRIGGVNPTDLCWFGNTDVTAMLTRAAFTKASSAMTFTDLEDRYMMGRFFGTKVCDTDSILSNEPIVTA